MVEHIRENPANALWVDMGLGKTISTLTAIQEMRDDLDIDKTLVVAPLRVARKTWTDERDQWGHIDLSTSLIIGTEKQRLAGMKREADVHLINRENMRWLVNHFVEKRKGRWHRTANWPWDNVVLDESTSFKNQEADRYRALRLMRKYIHRITELTGTPVPNGLMDLWGQLYLLDRGRRLGSGIGDFRKRWFDPPDYNQFKWHIKPGAESQIHNKVKDICMTLRAEDYLELPPVMFNYIRVALTPSEQKKYEHFKRHAIMELKGKRITAVNAGVLWGKLLQLSNGSVYTRHPHWEEFHAQKIAALLDVVSTIPGKALIAYNYVSDLHRIKRALAKARLNWRLLDTETDERDWNDGKIDYLILHPASAGHGLNLHYSGAEEIIWFGLTPNAEHYSQLNARLMGGLRREGRNIRVHHIVADGTQDMDLIDSLGDKLATEKRLMEATKRMVREI